MDLNTILTWIAGFSCLLLIYSALRSPVRPWGWLGIGVGVLAAMGVTALFNGPAGYVGGVLWGFLLLAPSLGMQVVAREAVRQRFDRAAQLSAVFRVLHPFDGYWDMPSFYRALEAERRGDLETAERYFTNCISGQCPIGYMANVYLFRLRGQWEEYVQWVREQGLEGLAAADLAMMTLYLRGLGEIGELAGLVEFFRRHQTEVLRADPISTDLCALMVFAFSGHRRGTELVLSTSLAPYPETTRAFWRATTDLAAGDRTARERLAALADSDNHVIRLAAQRRLSVPLTDPQSVLTPDDFADIDRVADEIEREDRYRPQPKAMAHAYATYGLVLANIIMFIVEATHGGSMNEAALIRLGAGITGPVLHGEWWRLITAQFLHFGWLHITLNMLALLIFGRVLEARLGHARFLAVYLLAGMVAVWFALFPFTHPEQTVVGASGSIMALIGAFGATSLLGWVRERARVARSQINLVIFIVGSQSIFDLFTPQVSGIAHLSGAIAGFALTLLLMMNWTGRRTAAGHGQHAHP